MALIPHCDSRILHAPKVCDFCDLHPAWQTAREMWGINFTGERDPDKSLCPSEQARNLRTIERWYGNVPVKGGQDVKLSERPFYWLKEENWEETRSHG